MVAGDARRMSTIPDGSVALVVTSPPYPMIPQWDGLFRQLGAAGFEGMHRVLDAVWVECHRVLLPGGVLCAVVGDALRRVDGDFQLWPNHARVLAGAWAAGFRPLPYVLWKKPTNKPNAFLGSGFLPPNAYVTLDCEFILLLRKGGPRAFPRRDATRLRSRYSRAQRDRWFSQVWEGIRGAPQGPEDGRNASFPAEIPERLIRMFSVVGDTVLDPFAGDGTTLWAARRLGRRAVGVEIDPIRARKLVERAREAPSARRGGRRPPPSRG